MNMDYETLKLEEKDNGILVVNLNRPEKYNAMNRVMVNELNALLRDLQHNLDIRVVILKGEGKGFCAGMDVINTWTPEIMNGPKMYDFQYDLGNIIVQMRQIPQPIIGVIHGVAAGAGLGFALATDIRVVSHDARFSAAFVNVGLGGADMGSSYFLTRLIPAGIAYDMMYTGRYLQADEAYRLGLVSRAVEKDQLMETAMEIAENIAAKDPFVMKVTKEAINFNMDAASLEAAIKMENKNQSFVVANHLHKSVAAGVQP